MPDYNYTRSLLSCGWVPNADLAPAIKVALPGKTFTTSAAGASLVITFGTALSGTEEDTLDALVASHISEYELALAKARKFKEIDMRTEELIAAGFVLTGKTFSLSEHAQAYWNGLGSLVSNGLLVEPGDFPIVVNTRDDSDTHSLTTIADVLTFFGTAAAVVKSHLVSGTTLKSNVRAATTVAEVNAVVDNR